MKTRSLISLAVPLLAAGAFLGLLGFLLGDERIASLPIDGRRTLNVYAEGAFHYEPPGYLYFELERWGQTRVPKRRFMSIGPERKPRESFTLIASEDDEVVALLLNNEVQLIHEFSSGYTWPGPYTNVTRSQWEIAELLLEKLRASHPGIRCPRQAEYRRQLDRDKNR